MFDIFCLCSTIIKSFQISETFWIFTRLLVSARKLLAYIHHTLFEVHNIPVVKKLENFSDILVCIQNFWGIVIVLRLLGYFGYLSVPCHHMDNIIVKTIEYFVQQVIYVNGSKSFLYIRRLINIYAHDRICLLEPIDHMWTLWTFTALYSEMQVNTNRFCAFRSRHSYSIGRKENVVYI